LGWLHGHAGQALQTFGQCTCVGVVVSQTLDLMFQRIQRRSRHHAGLPHASTQHLADAVRTRNQRFGTHQGRAHGRAQAFAEADRHAVKVLGDFKRRRATGHHGVEQARAIQMRGQALAAGQGRGRFDVRQRQHLATPGVFQRQQPRLGEVRVVGLDGGSNIVQRNRAIGLVRQRLRLNAAQHRCATPFPAVGVRHLADQVFITTLAMRHQATQVALSAGGHIQRGIFAQHLCDAGLQRVHRRVVTKNIVTQRRSGHGRTHAGCGLGDGVAAQVNGLHGASSLMARQG
jgi:hypothetical protein